MTTGDLVVFFLAFMKGPSSNRPVFALLKSIPLPKTVETKRIKGEKRSYKILKLPSF